jgi:hypothetical protein
MAPKRNTTVSRNYPLYHIATSHGWLLQYTCCGKSNLAMIRCTVAGSRLIPPPAVQGNVQWKTQVTAASPMQKYYEASFNFNETIRQKMDMGELNCPRPRWTMLKRFPSWRFLSEKNHRSKISWCFPFRAFCVILLYHIFILRTIFCVLFQVRFFCNLEILFYTLSSANIANFTKHI